MNPGEQMRVKLRTVKWVRLPDTNLDVYLKGKPGEEGVEVVRTHVREEFGGWDLEPVLDRIFLRQVRG